MAERAGTISFALDDFLRTTFKLPGEPADEDLPTELGDVQAAATPTAGVNNAQYAQSNNGFRCVRVWNLDVFSHPVGGPTRCRLSGFDHGQTHHQTKREIGEPG